MTNFQKALNWIKDFFVSIALVLIMISFWFLILPSATGSLNNQVMLSYYEIVMSLKASIMAVYHSY